MDICGIHLRIKALQKFKEEKPDEYNGLIAMYKRVNGVLKRAKHDDSCVVDPSLFETEAEKRLYDRIQDVHKRLYGV